MGVKSTLVERLAVTKRRRRAIMYCPDTIVNGGVSAET